MANVGRSRRSGYVLRGGRQRRETLWFHMADTATTLVGGEAAALFTGLPAALLALRPFTIVRVRGHLAAGSDQSANTEPWLVSLGLCVVSDQAMAIGVTAVPTPQLDAGSDLWFVYETLAGRFVVSSAVGLLESMVNWKDFDSRAMRKVEEGQDLAAVVESGSISTGVVVIKSGRILIKLH